MNQSKCTLKRRFSLIHKCKFIFRSLWREVYILGMHAFTVTYAKKTA